MGQEVEPLGQGALSWHVGSQAAIEQVQQQLADGQASNMHVTTM